MKRNFLIITLFAIWINGMSQINISGLAFMDGRSNHAGIKVKFLKQSFTAVSDSTFTNSDGFYDLSLKIGIYKVSFTSTSGEVKQYLDSNSVFLNKTDTLSRIHYVNPKLKFISGEISGILTNNFTYIATGDLEIPANATLEIQPGTEIRFDGYYRLKGDRSTLICKGTPTSPILFTSNKNNMSRIDWEGIQIYNSKVDIDYTIVEYSFYGIYLLGNWEEMQYSVTNSEVRNFTSFGISSAQGIISNNSVHDFSSGGTGILSGKTRCECNTIFNGGVGIAGAQVFNNVIHDVKIGLLGSYGNIENNYVYNSKIALSFSYFTYFDQAVSTSEYEIKNNMFFATDLSMFINDYGPVKGDIHNNLFVSDTLIETVNVNSDKINVSHNMFICKETNNPSVKIVGLGGVVATNVNKQNIDSYFNVVMPYTSLDYTKPIDSLPLNVSGVGKDGKNIGFNYLNTCIASHFGRETTKNPVISSDTLSISGTVHQGSSKLGAGSVMAINKTTNATYSTAVSGNGTFKIDSIPAGNYILKSIPTSPLSNSYANTYYPNKTEESQAVTLALAGIIIDVDIYLALINGIEVGTINDWSVSPNPFTDQLVISSTSQISILDAVGNIVYNGTPTDKLDTSNWKAGLYILKNKNKAQKLIKY